MGKISLQQVSNLPESILKIEKDKFLNDLPDYYLNNVVGWQIIPILVPPENTKYSFRYVAVKSGHQLGNSREATSINYCSISVSITINGIQPQFTTISTGPFIRNIFTNGIIPDFFFLARTDLDFLLINNPTHLFISKLIFNNSVSVVGAIGDYPALKFECTRHDLPVIISYGQYGPAPLYIIAPPCPPMWNEQLVEIFGPSISMGN